MMEKLEFESGSFKVTDEVREMFDRALAGENEAVFELLWVVAEERVNKIVIDDPIRGEIVLGCGHPVDEAVALDMINIKGDE